MAHLPSCSQMLQRAGEGQPGLPLWPGPGRSRSRSSQEASPSFIVSQGGPAEQPGGLGSRPASELSLCFISFPLVFLFSKEPQDMTSQLAVFVLIEKLPRNKSV